MKLRHVTGLRKLFSLLAVGLSGLASAFLPAKAAAEDDRSTFKLYDDRDYTTSKTAGILRRDLHMTRRESFRFRLPLNEENTGSRNRAFSPYSDMRVRRRFYEITELSRAKDGSFELSASVFTERYRKDSRKEGRDVGLYIGFTRKF